MVSASIWRLDSRLIMTLVPRRVSKPFLPVVTGIVRIILPPRRTVMVCAFTSTVLIMAEPTLKVVEALRVVQMPGLVSTPAISAVTLTLVPGAQYSAGRQISCRASSQPQAPSTCGEVVTDTSFSMSSCLSSSTSPANCTTTGIPTPTSPLPDGSKK